MNETNQSNAADNKKWEHRFYYAERVARIIIPIAPFVFFSTLFAGIFQHILKLVQAPSGGTVGPCDAQGHGLSLLVQEIASHGTESIAILLGCITILLLASMALIARAIQRD